MDISKHNLSEIAEKGFEFEVVHPDTGEGLDGFITVRGARSKTVAAYERKRINQQLVEEAESARKNKALKPKVKLVEDYLEDKNEAAAVRVIGWRKIEKDGQPIPFSYEAALELFKQEEWIADQVLEVSKAPENFPSGSD